MNIKIVKPSSLPEKSTRTTVDTIELTAKLVASWKSPAFQRPLKITPKVLALAEEIRRNGGVLPGIITIGVLDGDTYVVDGQHRLAAWSQSGCSVGYTDVRTHFFKDIGEMAQEFVNLNSALVRLNPDDILRGLEPSKPVLQAIRRKCRFVGYDMIRRGENSPMLSMSVFVRVWAGTAPETPQLKASVLALDFFTEEETAHAIDFVTLCYEAWQRDYEYRRLWGALNLALCAWLYRRVVLETPNKSRGRGGMTKEQFRKCLMSLSAESSYLDYLVGRNLGERDRAPSYQRVKTVFQRRYQQDTGTQIRLPQPAWSHA